MREVEAGHRFFTSSDKIDSFVLIITGKVGIFYPDPQLVKEAAQFFGRLVICTEAQAL